VFTRCLSGDGTVAYTVYEMRNATSCRIRQQKCAALTDTVSTDISFVGKKKQKTLWKIIKYISRY